MIFIYVVFFLSKSMIREIAAARGPGGPRADKNADLLEVIKLNLRTNNDDYTDTSMSYNATKITFIPSKRILFNMRRKNNIEDVNNDKREKLKTYNEFFINSDSMDNMRGIKKHSALNNSNVAPRQALKTNQMFKPIIDYQNTETEKTSMSSAPSLTTHVRTLAKSKANKIESIKKFYEQNKVLLKEFLSSKIAAKTQTTTAIQKPEMRQKAAKKPKLKQNTAGAGGNGVLSRGQDWLGNEEAPEPPNPDRLDMMPAIGGRINFKRIEGRLCHRHVIIPEGPKYDSKGRVYLAAHAAKVRRPYNVTRRPRLLLPKCCNCCRKSVLGCE